MEEDLFSEIDLGEDLDDEIEPQLDSLVGPAGKFKDIASLAKAKLEADRFIERLKAENAEARQKLGSAHTLESVMKQVEQLVASNKVPEQVNQHLENQNPAIIDDSKLKSLVSELLNQSEFERKVQANREVVQSAVVAEWGSEATVQLNKKARELGISVAKLKAVADESPAAFYRLVGIGNKAGTPSQVPTSSLNSTGKVVLPSGAKPQSHYNQIKLQDPKRYFSKETQAQMMNDAVKMGSSFFDA